MCSITRLDFNAIIDGSPFDIWLHWRVPFCVLMWQFMFRCWGVICFDHILVVAIVDVFHPARSGGYHPLAFLGVRPWTKVDCLRARPVDWTGNSRRGASHSWRMATACCGSSETRRAGTDTPYHFVARPVHQLRIPHSFPLLAWTRSQCSCCRCSRVRPSSRLPITWSSCTGWHLHSSPLLCWSRFLLFSFKFAVAVTDCTLHSQVAAELMFRFKWGFFAYLGALHTSTGLFRHTK